MTHRIVIVGGGAGGLELATSLGRKLGKKGRARITLVDSQLTHLWKPLLHEVAAGSLNASENELNYVAQAKWNHFEFQIGRLSGVDRAAKKIALAATLDADGQELVPARSLDYDTLVIAVGSTTNDFGTQGAAEHCYLLDTPIQAQRFHQQLLSHYLRAHAAPAQQAIDVVIVGAGATGVELAAELHNAAQELAAYGLDKISPQDMRITLVEAGPRVLPALPERIGGPVHTQLERIGVRVRTGARVEAVSADGLRISGGETIPAALKVWAAGIRAPLFLASMDGLETNRIHQLLVRPTLQTTLDDNIFALGDCAACPLGDGSKDMVPPRAQAAHQQASMLVASMRVRLAGGNPLPSYRYRDYGSLVSLSHHTAVGNLMGRLMGSVKVEGWLARMFYISLYRMHQVALYGFFRTGLLMLSDRIGRATQPRLKLH